MEVAPSTKLTADICIIRKLENAILHPMRNILLFCSLLFFACGEYAMMIRGEEQELYQNYKLLNSYFYHPEKIKDYKEYNRMEVDEMYASLEDYFCGVHHVGECRNRYTFYLPPEKYDNAINNIQNTKKYYSFGFERGTNKTGDTLIVSAVYPISPATIAGLKKKDRLLFANEVSLTGEDLDTNYLKTDSLFETSTIFKVLRDGEVKTLTAMRKAEVSKPTVYLDSIEGIPYIRITEFKVSSNNQSGTYAEFKKYLQEIKEAKAAIMDLRSNGGGNIGHCTAMVSELVPLNSKLIYDVEHLRDENRGDVVDTQYVYAKDYLKQEGDGINIKWVVLIDNNSASCSERLLAALKYSRPETVIIGQTSYGKGIGQIYTKTYAGGLAYITCLQTFYPDGKTFHNVGIAPDMPTDKPKQPNTDRKEDKEGWEAWEKEYVEALNKETMKAVEVAQNFGLAKRSSISQSVRLKDLPPERLADNPVPGAYKRIEAPLFH